MSTAVEKAIQKVFIEHSHQEFHTYIEMAERMIEVLNDAGYEIRPSVTDKEET